MNKTPYETFSSEKNRIKKNKIKKGKYNMTKSS